MNVEFWRENPHLKIMKKKEGKIQVCGSTWRQKWLCSPYKGKREGYCGLFGEIKRKRGFHFFVRTFNNKEIDIVLQMSWGGRPFDRSSSSLERHLCPPSVDWRARKHILMDSLICDLFALFQLALFLYFLHFSPLFGKV